MLLVLYITAVRVIELVGMTRQDVIGRQEGA